MLISHRWDLYCICRLEVPKEKVGTGTGLLEYIHNKDKKVVGLKCPDCKKEYIIREKE